MIIFSAELTCNIVYKWVKWNLLWCFMLFLELCLHAFSLYVCVSLHILLNIFFCAPQKSHIVLKGHWWWINADHLLLCVLEPLRLLCIREIDQWLCKCVNKQSHSHPDSPVRSSRKETQRECSCKWSHGVFWVLFFFKRVKRNNRNSCECLAAAQRRCCDVSGKSSSPYEISGQISFSPAKNPCGREHIRATSPYAVVWWGRRPAMCFWKACVSSINRGLFFEVRWF